MRCTLNGDYRGIRCGGAWGTVTIETLTIGLIIGAFVVTTVAIAALVLAPRMFTPRVVFDKTPDPPAAFGYRMAWLAIRSTDTAHIAEVLQIEPIERANWRTGIGTVYDERLGEGKVYLTPPVNGWTFVVGLSLPQPLGRGFVDKCTTMLLDLAGSFPEAQYFLSYPPIDFFGWARVQDGKLVRAYAIGDEGIIWNKGKPTREERGLGVRLGEVRGVRNRKGDAGTPLPVYPTEHHVMHLASCWSLDPTTLAAGKADADSGIGYVCATPGAWKPERLRRTA